MSDKMSSVSNSSKFSVKSQQVIAAQDEKIAMMRKLLAENGIDPDSIPPPGENMEVDDTTNAKKRMPSGSPEGKHWESTDSSSDSENDAGKMKDKNKGSGSWKLTNLKKKGRNEVKQPTKKERKRANRLAKAKENKLEAMKLEQSRAVRAGQVEQVEQVLRVMQTQIQSEQNINKPKAQLQPHEVPAEHGQPVLPQNPLSLLTSQIPVCDIDPMPEKIPVNTDATSSMGVEANVSPSQTRLFSSIVAGSARTPGSGGNNAPAPPPVFKTPAPDGPFRDEIIIEILSMDNKEFKGTITPTEARKTIFEDVLGFKQGDLAGVKMGFNLGRIITFKLKQQVDVDELFKWEKFSFERSVGRDVGSINCLIRGLRDPNKRRSAIHTSMREAQSEAQNYFDNGTRLVKITGCDYKLLESEILDWLVLFGEVVSEITEELYEDLDDTESRNLPPVGNGNYLVKMKLKKDLPNCLPIYGKRICLEYRGNRKQCNWCFGFHMRKYCKNEKMGMEEYVDRFKIQHPEVPEPYYGKLAKTKIADPNKEKEAQDLPPTGAGGKPHEDTRPSLPKLKLRRDGLPGASWEKIGPIPAAEGIDTPTTEQCVSQAQEWSTTVRNDSSSSRMQTTRIATGNAVNSMLNVIRATFKPNERDQVVAVVDETENDKSRVENSRSHRSRSNSATRVTELSCATNN